MEASIPDNRFQRDASGRLTFNLFRVSCGSYRVICEAVAAAFGLSPETSLTDGPDVVFQDYRLCDQIVGLEWDNWAGFTVVAKNPASESLVRDIATWLLRSDWGAA